MIKKLLFFKEIQLHTWYMPRISDVIVCCIHTKFEIKFVLLHWDIENKNNTIFQPSSCLFSFLADPDVQVYEREVLRASNLSDLLLAMLPTT